MGALGSDTCSQLATNPKIRSQTKNGRIIIEIVKVKVPDGSCRGQTVQVIAIGYQPKRGFRGKDEGSVSRRLPPRRYHEREVALTQTRKYIITVK